MGYHPRYPTLLFLIALVVLAGAAQGAGAADIQGITRDDALNLVVSDVLQGNTEDLWVYADPAPVGAGTTIETWYGAVALPGSEGWLFFIDDAPMQSWAHPCRYVHVDAAGAATVTDALGPPEDLGTWDKVAGSATPPPGPALRPSMRVSNTVSNAIPPCTDMQHCWAVLISGGANRDSNWPRYYSDIQAMYRALLIDYGYLDQNIIVLMSDGTDPADDIHTQADFDPADGVVVPDLYANSDPDLDGDGDDDVGFSATRANIATVFNDLQVRLGAGDHLFVFTTDHGGPENNPQVGTDVVENLWGETIRDDEFATELDKVDTAVPIAITMEQCFSGGFSDDVIPTVPLASGQDRVIATAANDHEVSYGDAFSKAWIAGVAGHDVGGTAVDADADNDGTVSLREAFDYAVANDYYAIPVDPKYVEHPTFTETPAGIGSSLALSSCYAPCQPLADAGPDRTVEQTALAGTPVILDGSGSSDPCGAALTYAWTWAGGSASSVSPTATFPLGTTEVTLVVTADGRASEPEAVSVTVVDTTPPVLGALPADVTVEQSNGAGTPVALAAPTATDICDAAVQVTSDAPSVFPLGETKVTFTARDDSGNSASGSMKVTVEDTTPPTVTAPADVTVEQATQAGTAVSLSATASDICDADPVVKDDAPAVFPLGETVVTFTATDASGNSATATTTVSVVDTTPPAISVTVKPTVLWPVNHKMVEIRATVTAKDICDAAPVVRLLSITSDEPDDMPGIGDGETSGDVQEAAIGTLDKVFKLRAERAGELDGRVYTVTYTATDASGNVGTGTATVTAPLER